MPYTAIHESFSDHPSGKKLLPKIPPAGRTNARGVGIPGSHIQKGSYRPNSLYPPVFIAGICSLVVEIAGGRLLAPYVGTGIYTWAAVIGLVLASLSVGYYLGGKRADQNRSPKELGQIFLGAAIATLAIPFIFRILGPFTLVLPLIPATLLAATVLVPASLLYGMISPYVIKLSSRKDREGEVAGSIFALSTLGSIAGALGAGFVLVPNMQLTHIFILTAFSMLASSWWIARKTQLLDGAVFMVFALFTATISFGYYPGTVLYEGDSAYYHISVLEEGNRSAGEPVKRLLILNNAVSSGEDEKGMPVFRYILEGWKAYQLVENPRTALVIGAGAGTQMKDLKRQFPQVKVDGVEIDPAVVEIGERYFSLQEDARTRIMVEDARRYLKTTPHAYDLVLMDAYRSYTVPAHLATREFVAELKQRLNPDGVVIINVISALEGPNAATFNLVRNAYQSEFGYVGVLPISPENPAAIQNVVLVATDLPAGRVDAVLGSDRYAPQPPTTYLIPTDEQNPVDLYQLK